jgi:hypothetical protein
MPSSRVLEDERPVVLVEMLVEAQARRRARKQAGQCRLAHGERITAQVVTGAMAARYHVIAKERTTLLHCKSLEPSQVSEDT